MDIQRQMVLVAEDDFVLRYLARRQLHSLGYDCELAVDGKDAFEKTKSEKYDLIFMDVQMPIMNGLEATQAIRKHEKDTVAIATPIMAMTANPHRQQCIDAGMDDFIFKPVSLEQMKLLLIKWLGVNELPAVTS